MYKTETLKNSYFIILFYPTNTRTFWKEYEDDYVDFSVGSITIGYTKKKS